MRPDGIIDQSVNICVALLGSGTLSAGCKVWAFLRYCNWYGNWHSVESEGLEHDILLTLRGWDGMGWDGFSC